jgi:NADP-dependent 3-hydroxy acid dehydrogenase YdfG
MKSVSLEGKVVLITGASSGFGEDSAKLFAKAGCKVILAARRLERLQSLVDLIQQQGGEALAIPVDVAQRDDITQMVQSAIDLYGRIDILFNNAGFGRLNWLENLNPERDIETQVQVNLLGTIQVTRAVLPHMLAQRSGHIINMSSIAGMIAAPLYTIYSTTKFGIRAFSDSLRREVAPLGIKVSVIYPGPAATEFGLHIGDHEIRRAVRRISDWHLSSEYVARRVVGLARRPRRSLIIPWWYHPVIAFDTLFPGAVDLILKHTFVKKHHKLERGDLHEPPSA